MATFTLMFWSTADWFGEKKLFHEPWNDGAREANAFHDFCSFKNLKSSFSEDNRPIHVLDVFIEIAIKMV